MDEYQREIEELRAQIAAMVEADEDAREIADLEAQARVLDAIYEQVAALLPRGEVDAELRQRLAMRGYGEWTLDNVYAYVYELAVDLPIEVEQSFPAEIRATDFAAELTRVPLVG
ncbi:MAG: hypothetical protein WAM30_14775 [Candidatus Dormiibacterota bacterium]